MSYNQPQYNAMLTSEEATIASPAYDLNFISQHNQIGHNVWPVFQTTPLTEFRNTLGAANSTYRPVLGGYRHAEQMSIELMATYNVPNTIITDIPDLNLEGEKWVRLLHSAVYDFSQTIETPANQHYRNLSKPDYYSEGVMHIMLWKVLNKVVEAQQGICSLPPWYTTDGPIYKAYPSFAERFQDVEWALRASKACCCSLFSSSEFAARLTWNPSKEFGRKRTNQNLNFAKTAVQAIGIQTCRERGISRNQDGELEDKDGNKVAGKKDVATVLTRSLIRSVKRRTQLSERAKVTSKLIAPAMTQDSTQELVSMDEHEESSSGAQTASSTSPENADDTELLLSQISKRNTNTISAFTRGTSTEPQSFCRPLSFLEPQAYLNTQANPGPQLSLVSQTAQQPEMPQPPHAFQREQTSQQPPVPYSHTPFQSHSLVDHGYGPPDGITPRFNNQPRQYRQWPNNAQSTNTPWLGISTHNLQFATDTPEQRPRNGDQEENPYNSGQNNNNPNDGFWDPNVFQR
ncbi:hypothetical protein F5Y12DRAFT_794602 [Xylaria sp. FL1777]|nr:hypothetical protein F5Y12DRAFT_794602 [Xylaria sp. FL1777]